RAWPWTGSGPDTFALFFERFQTPEFWNDEWGRRHAHAHSVYLNVLATRGVLGVAAAVGVAWAALATARRSWQRRAETRTFLAGLAGAFAAFAVAGAFGVFGNAGAAMVFVLLGTIAGLAGAPSEVGAPLRGKRREGGPAAGRG